MPWVDRFTVNWSSPDGLKTAARFRKLVGERNMNRVLKALIERYVVEREARGKNGQPL
mgnify:CR=1 FL=1